MLNVKKNANVNVSGSVRKKKSVCAQKEIVSERTDTRTATEKVDIAAIATDQAPMTVRGAIIMIWALIILTGTRTETVVTAETANGTGTENVIVATVTVNVKEATEQMIVTETGTGPRERGTTDWEPYCRRKQNEE